MAKQTPEQEAAIQRWIDEVMGPDNALSHDVVRRKFRRLNLTVEEIDADRLAKLKSIKGPK